MRIQSSKVWFVLAVLVLLVGVVGCTPPSPEEQVAASRAQYKVTLNAFVPQEKVEEPMVDPMMDGDDAVDEDAEVSSVVAEVAMAEEEGTDEEEGMDELTMDEPSGPQPTDVLFDLVVLLDGSDPLDGLTLDISQADPFEQEKATFRHYIDVSGMVKSETRQVSFTLEIPEYETGDLFSVNLREYVAPEERGEYTEFAAAP